MQFHRWVESPPEPKAPYRLERIQPWTFGAWSHPVRNVVHLYPGLSSLAKDFGPDLIEVFNEPYSLLAYQGLRLARARSIPLIFASAQNILKARPWPFSRTEAWVFEGASHAFCVNAEVVEVLRQKGYRAGASVLPLGIDPQSFERVAQHDPDPPLRIGYLGKLDHQKGVDLLLEASAKLVRSPRVEVVGSGPKEAELRAQAARLGLEDCHFRGAISREEVPAWLATQEVLVAPSRTVPGLKEQFGRSLLEGMAAGCCAVVSDSGELAQVLGEPRWVFPEGDVPALREKLEALDADCEIRRTLGARLRQRAFEVFGWETIARSQLEVYRTILSGKKS